MKKLSKILSLLVIALGVGTVVGCKKTTDPTTTTVKPTTTETPTTTKATYQVTFRVDGQEDKVVSVKEGEVPSYGETSPTKAGDAQYSYTFTGWDTEVVAATENKVYVAQFSQTVNKYNVKFVVNGVEQSEEMEYGATITAPAHTVLAGYNFTWDIEVPQTVTGNVTVTEIKSALTDVQYLVEHYQQNLADDFYTLVDADTQTLYGTTDTLTSAVAKTYTGFTAETVTQANINGDGSTIIEIKYNRNTYTVTINANGGEALYNDQAVTEVSELKYGTPAAQLNQVVARKVGYSFVKWQMEYQGEYVDIPTGAFVGADLTIKAIYEAAEVKYTVNHLYQNLENDEYALAESQQLNGLTESLTEAVAKTVTGFTSETVTQVTIAADGSTVVNVKYNRNTYTVTVDANGGSASYKGEVVTEVSGLKYGTPTAALAQVVATKAGYTFSKWQMEYSGIYVDIPDTATLEDDLAIKAVYTANTNTPFTVTIYAENLDGTYSDVTESYKALIGVTQGTTDTEVDLSTQAIALAPAGFGYYPTHESNKASGVIAGDGSLALSLYFNRSLYSVTWSDGTGTIKTETYKYGATPSYDGATPTSPADLYRTYTFRGWNKAMTPVTDHQYYYAVFDINAKDQARVNVYDAKPILPILFDMSLYTVNSIKVGDVSLGNDLNNLSLSGLTNHGLQDVVVNVSYEGYSFNVNTKALFVTREISTRADFQKYVTINVAPEDGTVRIEEGKYYVLTADIDYGTNSFGYDGTNWGVWCGNGGYGFAGTLDGQGHKITGQARDNSGIFGALRNATIMNLNIYVKEMLADNAAILCCSAYDSCKLSNINVYVDATVTSSVHCLMRLSNGASFDNVNVYAPNMSFTNLLGNGWFSGQTDTFNNCEIVAIDCTNIGNGGSGQVPMAGAKGIKLTKVVSLADTQYLIKSESVNAISLGSLYEGYTATSITLGTTSLGTDLNNLDLSKVTTYGANSLLIEANDGENYIVVNAPVIVATASIKTVDDWFQSVWYAENETETLYHEGYYYVLANDINFNGARMTAYNSINSHYGSMDKGFAGTLDGRGFKVYNGDVAGWGIFGSLVNATIKDVTFDINNMVYANTNCVFAGVANNTKFINVTVKVANALTTTQILTKHAIACNFENLVVDCKNITAESLLGSGWYSGYNNTFKNATVYAMDCTYVGNGGAQTTILGDVKEITFQKTVVE